ncbi:uncharacterized protein K02A2.6-like [Lytechinus pictus]|uniref:uncharacterized protein K02A2.6-like n=1 Tax=Lytechinus pictus TaxID=7653 RepID=UPI0030B9DDBE
MIRDRLVVGCRDIAIQRKLLSESSLTLQHALQTATAMEVADRDVEKLKVLSKGTESPTVQKMEGRSQRKPFMSSSRKNTHQRQKQEVQEKPSQKKQEKPASRCWRCGSGDHGQSACRFKDEKCYQCSQVGHTRSQCEKIKQYRSRKKYANHLNGEEGAELIENMPSGELRHLRGGMVNKMAKYSEPFQTSLSLNGIQVNLEIDTGSPWTMMSQQDFHKLGHRADVKQANVSLKTYTESSVPIIGEAMVEVKFDASQPPKKLTLLVVEKGVALLGRDWMQAAPEGIYRFLQNRLNLQTHVSNNPETVHKIQATLQDMLVKHKQVFDCSKVGKLEGYQAKVHPQDDGDKARFYKAAPVPYAMRQKIDEAIDELQDQGVIEPVKFADYACPIVVVKKPNGKVRICGNYKLTANKVLRVERYPIPSLQDMLQDLGGGQQFSKLDLSHAYHQIELDEQARKYTTVNTHRGLFQYTRLPFGIATAPALFQRAMESLLADIPMCRPYLDDIIVSGKTDEEHIANLQAVLHCLESNGLRLKREKCEFMMDSVEFLGHKLDQHGVSPLPDKIEAIKKTPRPQNQSQLQAYLGLLGYYRKFIPNLTKEIAPLITLLKAEYASVPKKQGDRNKADPNLKWGRDQERAFQKSKELVQSDTVLTHYDPSKPLLLQCDASPYGLGVVLSHVGTDGLEQPISFASRTLTRSEANYAQYEKEGLSVIFGVKKFHKYLYGRRFTIVTDHKPLLGIFGDTKPASPMASARLARWHMILSAYDYDIKYKEGKQHQNADALSRLPLADDETVWSHQSLAELDEQPPVQINMLDIDTRPVEADEVRRITKRDPVLARVTAYVMNGWPNPKSVPPELKAFAQKKEELSIEDDIILWGHRVVIPDNKQMRQRILDELHGTHPGIVKMKALARSFVWWPGIDKMLEEKVKTCTTCQEHQRSPPPAPIHPWEFPERPWSRIHIDYAYIDNQNVLIVVDAYTKWIEAIRVAHATAAATVTAMRRLFATYGIPETVVSDNGTQFVSEDFSNFLFNNNVEHVQTAPKHPSSNGLAERAVQTLKSGVKKTSGTSLEMRIQVFLMTYRITPQGTTMKTPSELMFKRRIRSRMDHVRPNLHKSVQKQQSAMKQAADKRSKMRQFKLNDTVLVKNFAAGPTWLRGIVTEKLNEVMYVIELQDGREVRRHVDHIRLYTISHGNDHDKEEMPDQNTNLQPEILIQQTQYPSQTTENPNMAPSTSESLISNTEQSIADTTAMSQQVQTESLSDSDGAVMPNMPNTKVMSERRMSNRKSKTPSKLRDFIVYH